MSGCLMIVDDEKPIRDSLQGLFEDEGYRIQSVASGEEAVVRFRKQPVDCVLLDIWMPGIDGLETLARLKKLDADLPVVMMSGHATIDTAVRATRQGAFDFVEKPLSSEKLLILVRNALEKRKLAQENVGLKQSLEQRTRWELIGESRQISEVTKLIQRLAVTDVPVLILGEHGTGKGVAARYLHRCSKRSVGPLNEVSTGSIQESRMDAELFGYEKGAFPGALHAQAGRLELADGGSLYFDEVHGLGLAVQAKILKALQQKSVQRLGSPVEQSANVRLIAASSYDLEGAMRSGAMREDFYYRLNVAAIHMPALRERIEDIPLLVDNLAIEHSEALGGEAVCFSSEAIMKLQAYPWPRNVLELRNYMERCHILRQGEKIGVDDMLPLDQSAPQSQTDFASNFHSAREAFERSYLLYYLNNNDWNISRTAEEIGMERSQLHRKIKAHGLDREKKPS